MERQKFTREFKLEAVRLIKERGVSYVQASQDLGVHVSQLRDWVKKFADDPERSEEHTSELQSPCNLVCRLLLEKKKKTQPIPIGFKSLNERFWRSSSLI